MKSYYKTFEKYNIQENYKIPIISGTQQIIQQIKPNRESFYIPLNTLEKYNIPLEELAINSLPNNEIYIPNNSKVETFQYMQKVPILYITLPTHENRKNYIEKQIEPLCSSGQRVCQLIDGVWGEDPKTGQIHPDYRDDMLAHELDKTIRTLKPSEFGCTMAHINAAKYMVKNKLPHALVVEDDANFTLMPDWPKTLEQIVSELPKGWTTCQLYFGGEIKQEKSGIKKKLAKNPGWGTVAYLLSAKGASIVSNIDIQTYNEDLVADIFMYKFPGAEPYIHYPRYIITGEMASTIHQDHENVHKEDSAKIVNEFNKELSNDLLTFV